jgi:hypothetical protein
MASITSGLLTTCADLNAVGGIRQIFITDLANVTTVTPATAPTTGIITNFVVAAANPWARFETKQGEAAMTINGTKEGGATKYEIGLNFYVPNITGARLAALQHLGDACPVAIVEFFSGVRVIVGFSYLFANQSQGTTFWTRNQTYASLKTIEGGSGMAITDPNGLTVTLSATQWELPYTYSGALSIVAGDITATSL